MGIALSLVKFKFVDMFCTTQQCVSPVCIVLTDHELYWLATNTFSHNAIMIKMP